MIVLCFKHVASYASLLSKKNAQIFCKDPNFFLEKKGNVSVDGRQVSYDRLKTP